MEGPGTILRDVETILEFIGPGGLKTKSQQGNLSSAVLPELNARLDQGRGTAPALGRSRRLGAHGGFQRGREAGP